MFGKSLIPISHQQIRQGRLSVLQVREYGSLRELPVCRTYVCPPCRMRRRCILFLSLPLQKMHSSTHIVSNQS